ncbi:MULTISPECIES: sulfotransferase family protein [Marinobacter]|uniref:sulfotransferase family protein n=1 Tax=Marinobacter TaxID=2742 RepID=UPI0019269DE8|nr:MULTISPECIES: sulfotransferase [Marinobacter]MBL3557543.1 sulfotransferase [Marinobacter sp. JB05H06]
MKASSAQDSRSEAGSDPGFTVPTWMHVLGGWIHRHPDAWIRLGNLETRVLQEAIADIKVEKPVYVAGLARSGTTVLLERLAEHPQVATHRYADFPPLLTPYWWNRWLSLVPHSRETAQERAHKDGIAITSQSPEAFEEMLWMAFFADIHDPARCEVFDRQASHPAFEGFYDEHIRKLLAIRRRQRYVAKGNYNLVRLGYLHKLYPDARFVVAIRDPVWHIASLMKQQRLFATGEAKQPRALEHMRRVGHFEFGLDRRAINVGDDAMTARITSLWNTGQEVEGWALYWADLYRHVADVLDTDPALGEACLVVHYEDLCNRPEEMLIRLHEHCELPIRPEAIKEAAKGLRAPTYYRPKFNEGELSLIREITYPVAARFGRPANRTGAETAKPGPFGPGFV